MIPEKLKLDLVNMLDSLDFILENFGVKTAVARELFKNSVTIREVPKNKEIIFSGKKDKNEYILISGILHRYNMAQNGDMITTGFYMPGSVVTPHFARTKKGVSIFNLQALTDSMLAAMPVNELDHLRQNNLEFYEFGKQVVEKELYDTFYNEVVFRSFNAVERLLAMREQYPNLENLVPHHIIASYLGITKVSLSRLRNELSKK